MPYKDLGKRRKNRREYWLRNKDIINAKRRGSSRVKLYNIEYNQRPERKLAKKIQGAKWYKNHREESKIKIRKYKRKIKDKYGVSINIIQRFGLKLALKIYDKYHRKCKECGSEYDLTIHHLDNKGWNYEIKGLKPNNQENNLVILCRHCHGKIHRQQQLLNNWRQCSNELGEGTRFPSRA